MTKYLKQFMVTDTFNTSLMWGGGCEGVESAYGSPLLMKGSTKKEEAT